MSCDDTDSDFPGENSPYMYNTSLIDDENDDMPHRYLHIRNGPRSVRPEFHVLMHTLKSELPLSEVQAQGARIGVANILFGRKDFGEGKIYKERQVCVYNALPAATNTNRIEPYIEAMILSGIVNEIMERNADVTVK